MQWHACHGVRSRFSPSTVGPVIESKLPGLDRKHFYPWDSHLVLAFSLWTWMTAVSRSSARPAEGYPVWSSFQQTHPSNTFSLTLLTARTHYSQIIEHIAMQNIIQFLMVPTFTSETYGPGFYGARFSPSSTLLCSHQWGSCYVYTFEGSSR